MKGLFHSQRPPVFHWFLLQKVTGTILSLELTLNPPEGILAGEHLPLEGLKWTFTNLPFMAAVGTKKKSSKGHKVKPSPMFLAMSAKARNGRSQRTGNVDPRP